MKQSNKNTSDAGSDLHDAGSSSLEHVSAMADGQARGEDFDRAVTSVLHETPATAAWHAYHLIGDVLRFGETAGASVDHGFASRFAKRLAQEAVPDRTRSEFHPVASEAIAFEDQYTSALARKHKQSRPQEAANNPNFRWKVMAGLATVAAMGAIGWGTLGNAVAPEASTQIAGAPATPPAAGGPQQLVAVSAPSAPSTASSAGSASAPSQPAQMIRDPRLDELLAAHEQAGGMSALQMPAGFFRNATFDGRGR